MNKIVCFIISIVSFLFIVRTPANADWVNLSGAQNAPNIAEEPVGGAWKITNLELLEEKRIDPYGQPKT